MNKALQEYLEAYHKSLRLLEKLSPETFRAKRNDLHVFYEFFQNHSAVNKQTWLSFCSFLKQNYKLRSLHRMCSSYRQFFRFISEEFEDDTFSKLEFPRLKSPQEIPRLLSYDQIHELLKDQGQAGRLLEFLYATGCRISEACQLKWNDIDPKRKVVRVLGKGKKQREIPLSDLLWARLNQHPIKSEFVFPAVTDATKALSPRQARRILRKLALQQGLPGKLYPHLVRHSLATHFLDAGADLRFIQEILGHESLSTTQVYLKTTKQRLMEVFDRTHPRA